MGKVLTDLKDYRDPSGRSLEEITRAVRADIVQMIGIAGSGHPGGSLSAVEVLVALYFVVMRINPSDPGWDERDRFILSKGHSSAGLYAALAERGFFRRDVLRTFDKIDSILQGHPDMRKTPGVDMSTGSLGQGLSVGVGMAYGAKLDGRPFRVYVLLGDGEVQEGQVWEAAMAASHYGLDNLTAVIDHNKLQLFGKVKTLLNLDPLVDKWKAFGWHVLEVDGHNISSLLEAFDTAKDLTGKPTVIIAHTVKGKGISFMEDAKEWHAKAPNKAQVAQALAELGFEEGELWETLR